MESTINPDYNNINIASSILEATNTDSHETLTIYPDLDTLVSIARCSKNEKQSILHTFEDGISEPAVLNEFESIYPGLNTPKYEKNLHTKRKSSSLNDSNAKYKCHVCYCTFNEEVKYKVHLVTHQQSAHVECHYCGKKMAYNRFVYHVMIHTGEKPFACDICGRGFRLKRDLRQHSFTHTGEKPYPCDICGRKFSDTSSRRKHFQIHTGERPYSCEICQRTFTQVSHLREHKVTHTKEKLHTCELCLKKFTTKSSMQRHMLTHDNTCEVCNCTFTTNNKLQKHKELHNAERPFSCSICFRRFRKRTDINTHMLIHSEEKNVICQICNEAFKSYRYLRVHYAGSHKGVGPPFTCPICSKGFFQDKSIKQHYSAHFNESNRRSRCPYCFLTFSCIESVKKHINLKNCNFLTCYECGRHFEIKDDLVKHLTIEHNFFSDSIIIPDVDEASHNVDNLNSFQTSVEKDFVKVNTNCLPIFPDSPTSSADEISSPSKNGEERLKNSLVMRKTKSPSKTNKSRKNNKLPTIVKVEVMSDASNSFSSEHDNNSCSSDKYLLKFNV